MKKLSSVLALVLAICMLCSCALANEQKYDEPVTVHFVRSTDDTLDANYFSQHPDKTMTDNLWCDLYKDELNIIVDYDWIVKSGEEYDTKLAAELLWACRRHPGQIGTVSIGIGDEIVPNAWNAGDVSAVPDVSKTPGPGGFCVPNAQHAVRQGKLLPKNIVASLRGEGTRAYVHANLGAVAGLGLGQGAFQKGKIGFTGPLAWMAHRGYHGLAMPMWERKLRVFGGWVGGFFLGRDDVQLAMRERPREVFEEFASRPKPAAEADVPKAAPVADTQPAKAEEQKVAAEASEEKAESKA